jgi:hypothetical protein
VLAAIAVPREHAEIIARLTDRVLSEPLVGAPLPRRPLAVLVDFSTAAGAPSGPEVLPQPGRHYNVIADRVAGAVLDAVDTLDRPTGIDIVITDGFADETAAGTTGAWNGAVDISGSLYDERAQLDSFFVGDGAGYSDTEARIEVHGLDPDALYRFRFQGNRSDISLGRVGTYRIGSQTRTLNAARNLGLEAEIAPVRPEPGGSVVIEIDNGGLSGNFAYLAVLEITRFDPDAVGFD